MWSIELWERFTNEHIVPIYFLTTKLLNFHSWLARQREQRVVDGLKLWPGLEVALFGGTRTTGEYEEGSIALKYHELLGLNTNIREYYSYLEQSIEPETNYIAQPTLFVQFLEKIQIVTGKVITLARKRDWSISIPEEGFQDLQDDSLKLISTSADLLSRCANVTVNANKFTLTAWILWGLTKRYIEISYPEAAEPEVFSFIAELLGLKPIFAPDVPRDRKEASTIYAYPDLASVYRNARHYPQLGGSRDSRSWPYALIPDLPCPDFCDRSKWREMATSGVAVYKNYPRCSYCKHPICLNSVDTIGGALCCLNLLIWEAFGPEYRSEHKFNPILTQIPDLHQEYLEQTETSLHGFKEPRLAKYSTIGAHPEGLEFEVRGPIISKSPSTDVSKYPSIDVSLPLLTCFDELMPFIYVGKFKPVFSEDKKHFRIIQLLVGE